MMASRVAYPPSGQLNEPHIRSTSPTLPATPATRIRTSGVFGRRLSLTAVSVANTVTSSSLFGSSPPPASSSSIYQQSSGFFRSSTSAINNAATASSTTVNSPVTQSPDPYNAPPLTTTAIATATTPMGRPRSRSTSHPPPPKYKTSRTPQLRISLQDATGNLVLSAPVMAPGESIRGQIHLELPKATPVHSIEVCLQGTVTALDGTRLGSMKTVTILEECKTVATASITNARTNTTRRHTTPSPPSTTSAASGGIEPGAASRPQRRGSVSVVNSSNNFGGVPPRDRAQNFPNHSSVNISTSAAISAAVAATTAALGASNARPSAEMMSRTFSMPSSSIYGSNVYSSSTVSLNSNNRPISTISADMRGRRTSFSANVDVPIVGGFGTLGGRANMSMVNISTLSQFPAEDDPSLPAAPSYDPPEYDGITPIDTAGAQSSSSQPTTEQASANDATPTTMDPSPVLTSESSEDTTYASTDSSTSVTEDTQDQSRRSSTDGGSSSGSSSIRNATVMGVTPTPTATTTVTTSIATTSAATDAEPKAVLMQPGNYVIPFSIRIPSNTTMSLPGSFTDPVGTISYQLKAVMKQILPSPDHYNPRGLLVEPTFSSSTQVIKLIPMNDPTHMPLYLVPYETESVRANVGHWVWSTGFLEAHAWVPKQGYRPGRMIPLVIHIVNHSDARQVVVETTLCRCLHYGSGLSKARAMGLAGQSAYFAETLEDLSMTITPTATIVPERTNSRRRLGLRSRRNMPTTAIAMSATMPSPPASPFSSNFPSTPTSEQGGESPEGSIHGATARMTSPSSIASISSQWESSGDLHSAPIDYSGGGIGYNPESRSTMTSPTPSSYSTSTTTAAAVLPVIQHQREKISKSRTLVHCSSAVDREIQKTILVPVPHTAGYSILNAPLLEVSYEIVVKIRVEKIYSKGLRLQVPIVVIIPEEGDLEDDDDDILIGSVAAGGLVSSATGGGERDFSLAFSGDEYDIGDHGECPPYEATAATSTRRRSRR
ncbi:hypothetical protein BGZ83_001172 [Gryganskiella cystojenkinii]|nr:hypothetical protein BGZ83_001172 [Gryganskiella cystojenkinii]